MDLIALTPLDQGSRKIAAGQSFSVPAGEGELLIALKRAYKTRAMTVEDEEVEVSPRTGLPKRAYRRRDMKAEK